MQHAPFLFQMPKAFAPVGVGNLSTLNLTVSEAKKNNVYPQVYIP